ncbi:MAG: hypothetical protein WDW38_001252 [Sanguina aurantia]
MAGRPYAYAYSPGRSQHIEDLLKAYPSAQPINGDRSVIDVPMAIANGKSSVLRVSLPPGFPQEKPLLQVFLPLGHPAVDSSGRLHFRSIDEWGRPGSEPASLHALVREAIGMLATASLKTEPGPSPQPQASQPQRQPASSATSGASQNGPPRPAATPAAELYLATETRSHLQHLPTSRLEELLTDDAALRGYIGSRMAASQAVQSLEALHDKNASLAASNLELGSTITQARGHVAIVRSSDYASARSLFDGLYARHQAVLTQLSPAVLLGQMRAEAQEVDDKSDALVESFYSGATNGSVDSFVEQYRLARVKFHVLDIKRQAAEHLVR